MYIGAKSIKESTYTPNTMFRTMINPWGRKDQAEEGYTGGLSSSSNVLFS